MVCFNNQLICSVKDQVMPKVQERLNVLNLAVQKTNEAALVTICIFQIYNLILL